MDLEELTEDDIPQKLKDKGWHYCDDWQKVIGPSMPEWKYCTCFENEKTKTRNNTENEV